MWDTKAEVKAFILDNMLMVESELPDDASLQGRGIVDSTGVLELVGFIESKFCITVEDNELRPENLDSVSAITAFVTKKLDEH